MMTGLSQRFSLFKNTQSEVHSESEKTDMLANNFRYLAMGTLEGRSQGLWRCQGLWPIGLRGKAILEGIRASLIISRVLWTTSIYTSQRH